MRITPIFLLSIFLYQTEIRDWITDELVKEPVPLLPMTSLPIKNTKRQNTKTSISFFLLFSLRLNSLNSGHYISFFLWDDFFFPTIDVFCRTVLCSSLLYQLALRALHFPSKISSPSVFSNPETWHGEWKQWKRNRQTCFTDSGATVY